MNPPHKIHYVREKHSSLCTKLLLKLIMKHGHSWEGAASEFDVAWRGVRRPTWLLAHRCRVWAFFFFFFYIMDSCRLGLICADLTWFVPNQADSCLTRLIRPKLGHIDWIRSYRSATETVEIGLESCRNSRNRFEWGPNILYLSFLNFILNICYFFCVFIFVLCFLPSSFFVL